MIKYKSPHRLPRRESERRNHPLIRHCDVLTAIETRISLLQMTFMKYVDAEVSLQVCHDRIQITITLHDFH